MKKQAKTILIYCKVDDASTILKGYKVDKTLTMTADKRMDNIKISSIDNKITKENGQNENNARVNMIPPKVDANKTKTKTKQKTMMVVQKADKKSKADWPNSRENQKQSRMAIKYTLTNNQD